MTDPQGRFVWCELMTTDMDAAEAFYTAVVGWSTSDMGQPGRRYTVLSAGERGVGGMMVLPEEARAAGGGLAGSAISAWRMSIRRRRG